MEKKINLSNDARKVLLAMILLRNKDNKKTIAFNDLSRQERKKEKKTFEVRGLNPKIVNKGIKELFEWGFVLEKVSGEFTLNYRGRFRKAIDWYARLHKDIDSMEKIINLKQIKNTKSMIIKFDTPEKKRDFKKSFGWETTGEIEVSVNQKDKLAKDLGSFFN